MKTATFPRFTVFLSSDEQIYFSFASFGRGIIISAFVLYSDTSANEDNSFRNHIR